MDNIKKNSIDTLLTMMLRTDKNIISTLSGLRSIYTESDSALTVEFTDNAGTTTEYTIPSIAYLIEKIKKLEHSYNDLLGIEFGTTVIRTTGTIPKTLYSSTPPISLSSTPIPTPEYFYVKSKNPLYAKLESTPTYIRIPVPDFQDSMLIKRYDLDVSAGAPVLQALLSTTTLEESDLLAILSKHSIPFTTTDSVERVEYRTLKYAGEFTILDTKKDSVLINDVAVNRLLYKVNTLYYTDLETGGEIRLAVGDKVHYTTDTQNDVFEVTFIDYDNSYIALLPYSGTGQITVSVTHSLRLYNTAYSKNYIEYPVSSGVMVLFSKAINPTGSIASTTWSAGTVINVNALKNGSSTTKEAMTEYKGVTPSVLDTLEYLTNEKLIPPSKLIHPTPPTLDPTKFTVSIINSHKASKDKTELLARQYSNKLKLEQDLKVTELALTTNRTKLFLGQYSSDTEYKTITTEIATLIETKKSITTEISAIIENILSANIEDIKFSPKYHVKGFIDVPAPATSDNGVNSVTQEIIGFDVEYRYLSNTDTVTDSYSPTTINTGTGTTTAVMSKWISLPTKTRDRDTKGNWIPEDYSSVDVINSNQVEIPITKGEKVEIRCKSISAVGYPTTKTTSAWSKSIVVEFPDSLLGETDTLLQNITNEKILLQLKTQLASLKLLDHATDSINIGERDYSHSADTIYTTFRTPENKPKSVSDILLDHSNNIEKLLSIINQKQGQLKVELLSADGVILSSVNNNTTNKIFAGYYTDAIATANVKKGEIVSKLYYIRLSNPTTTPIELVSFVPGTMVDPVPNVSRTPYPGYLHSKEEYTYYRKYWTVPVLMTGTIRNSEFYKDYKKQNPTQVDSNFQTSQTKGQLLYSRSRDITLNTDLVVVDPQGGNILPDFSSGNTEESFVWNGGRNASNLGGGKLTPFCVHVNHPDIQTIVQDTTGLYYGLSDATPTLPKKTVNSRTNPTAVYTPPFILSKYMATDTVQLGYSPFTPVENSATLDNFPKKLGFSANDKYLIGENTCGAFLYLAPTTPTILSTDSVVYNSGKSLSVETEPILIPVIFQCRMTDYYGAGDEGTGRIGGTTTKSNLVYSKTIGVDLLIKNVPDLFSFDITVEMQYTKTTTV